MSGPLGSSQFMYSSGGAGNFYDHQIEQSARFDRDEPSSMNFTPSSAGDRNVWTFSVWIKLSEQYNYGDRGNYDTMILNAGSTGGYGSRFRIYLYDDNLRTSSATANHNISSGKYRDTSAWYHFVTKNNSGTVVQYVNGTQVSSQSLGDTAINNNVKHVLGARDTPTTDAAMDGYMAEAIFTDGTAYNPTQFGETKNGIWIPKDPSGTTFGSQGWHLKFQNASALGDDSSGNNNDWSVVNMGTDHQVLDSPTTGTG